MEDKHLNGVAESKKEETETSQFGYASSSNNLPSDQCKHEELTKAFEKNLEGLENLVKLFKSDVSKMFDTGSDLTILSEDYAKRLGFKIDPISPINASHDGVEK